MGSPAILAYQPRSLGLNLKVRRPTRRLVYGAAFILAILVYLSCSQQAAFQEHIWWRVREVFLYAGKFTRYNFKPTLSEQQCFDGSAPRINTYNLTDSIPETVHFIWTDESDIPFKLYLAIRAALDSAGPNSVHLHHDVPLNFDSGWLRLLERNLTFVSFNRSQYLAEVAAYHPEGWRAAHQIDAMRLHVLHAEGGVYLDSDAFMLQPLNNLFVGARDVYMGYEGGNKWGLCNGAMLAKAGAPFIARWLEEYATLDTSQWNDHSVILPKKLASEHPAEICILSPSTFFWPLWTERSVRWMHEPLDKEEAAAVEEQIAKNGGSLFKDQLIYHAWSQVSKSYLRRMTPDTIREEDTRFNLLMRRFV